MKPKTDPTMIPATLPLVGHDLISENDAALSVVAADEVNAPIRSAGSETAVSITTENPGLRASIGVTEKVSASREAAVEIGPSDPFAVEATASTNASRRTAKDTTLLDTPT
jgi:hypothetical protein